jgi:undecaprenyl-diphosphatase
MIDVVKAVLLGIVEGLTEFLPVSSTGHLIVASEALDFNALGGTFQIAIQFGAVLAVMWFYRAELFRQVRNVASDPSIRNLWLMIVVAAVPAGTIGFLTREWVKATLFKPGVVAIALIVGGVAFILIERRPRQAALTTDITRLTFRQALLIGLAQVAALVPGVSRAGATILGGLGVGLSRPAATSFSFFLAMPVLGGASGYEMLTAIDEIDGTDLTLLAVGIVSAFVFAFLAVGWLLRYVSRSTFTPFGYYRIAMGLVVLVVAFATPSAAQDAPVPAAPVEVAAADGQILRGTYYSPHGEAPAVLLIHQLYTTQTSWQFLVAPLNEAGFNVLTIDLRGYGQTRGRINWQAARGDVLTWAAWLDEQPGVSSVAMLGSSMGSALAVDGCFSYEPCTRAVALSPALAYYGVSIEDALAGDLPVMIAYADRDRYPARDMPGIVELAGDDLTLFTYAGRTHGIDLFALDETLSASVVSYLLGSDVSQPQPEPAAEPTAPALESAPSP